MKIDISGKKFEGTYWQDKDKVYLNLETEKGFTRRYELLQSGEIKEVSLN